MSLLTFLLRLFTFGCVTAGLTNIMFGFLPSIKSGRVFLGLSLLIRSLTAIGESAMSTAVYPLAMRCDNKSPATALAVMETMFGAGTTIGPFIGKCRGVEDNVYFSSTEYRVTQLSKFSLTINQKRFLEILS